MDGFCIHQDLALAVCILNLNLFHSIKITLEEICYGRNPYYEVTCLTAWCTLSLENPLWPMEPRKLSFWAWEDEIPTIRTGCACECSEVTESTVPYLLNLITIFQSTNYMGFTLVYVSDIGSV